MLGRISSGGGHPATGRACGNRNRRAGAGYAYFHHTVDDHSRLGYSENLTDDKKETAAAFWLRANAFFSAHGISVEAALTANGSCYSSRAFAVALTLGIKHRRTALPFRAQTNGKVERFNRTPLRKGPMPSRTTSEMERAGTYDAWAPRQQSPQNPCRIGGKTPISRIHNLYGRYT